MDGKEIYITDRGPRPRTLGQQPQQDQSVRQSLPVQPRQLVQGKLPQVGRQPRAVEQRPRLRIGLNRAFGELAA